MQDKSWAAGTTMEHSMTGDSRPAGFAAGLHLHDTLRLSAEGVAKALGDLEARVMAVVWSMQRPLSARAVHREIIKEHTVAVHTVITVLNKLVRKGLLRREKGGDVYEYSARVTEEQFRREVSRRAVEGLMSLGPDAVAACFVDVLADRDPAHLAALALLIQARLEKDQTE
jgi:predicted transcriptional regulator